MSKLKSVGLFSLVLAGIALMSMSAQAKGLEEAVQEYSAAWASHDVDRIVALHTEDSTFTLHIAGQEPAVGKAQIREQFQHILNSTPGYETESYQVDFGPDFVVIMYKVQSGPTEPLFMGDKVFTPDADNNYSIDAIDLLTFRDGLVSAKHTFIDLEEIREHSQVSTVTTTP